MSFRSLRLSESPETQPSFIKKALPVALGIALGLTATYGASAKAEDGISFYGRAHVTADLLDDGEDSGLNVSSNSSRVGIKGSTEVSDGLKGILQIEQEIRYDNGSGNFATRDTFVGLEGGFGGVRLGFLDTPLKLIRANVDFFGDQVGDVRNVTRLNQAPFSQDFDARFQNGIFYNTPKFGGGFVFNLHYGTNTTTGTNPPDDEAGAYSTSITYNTSNLYLALAYETWEVRNDSDAIRFGARYNLGDWSFAGLFQQASIESLPVAEDVQTLGVGASFKVSPKVLIKGQIYQVSAKDRDDSDAALVAIGADYILSKQLRLLFAYAATDNDDLVNYRATGGGRGDQVTPILGEANTGLSAGIRYDF